jgi:hypothetical protein
VSLVHYQWSFVCRRRAGSWSVECAARGLAQAITSGHVRFGRMLVDPPKDGEIHLGVLPCSIEHTRVDPLCAESFGCAGIVSHEGNAVTRAPSISSGSPDSEWSGRDSWPSVLPTTALAIETAPSDHVGEADCHPSIEPSVRLPWLA